jgi:hypothetical protein
MKNDPDGTARRECRGSAARANSQSIGRPKQISAPRQDTHKTCRMKSKVIFPSMRKLLAKASDAQSLDGSV